MIFWSSIWMPFLALRRCLNGASYYSWFSSPHWFFCFGQHFIFPAIAQSVAEPSSLSVPLVSGVMFVGFLCTVPIGFFFILMVFSPKSGPFHVRGNCYIVTRSKRTLDDETVEVHGSTNRPCPEADRSQRQESYYASLTPLSRSKSPPFLNSHKEVPMKTSAFCDI